jgi:hypothetical protein
MFVCTKATQFAYFADKRSDLSTAEQGKNHKTKINAGKKTGGKNLHCASLPVQE